MLLAVFSASKTYCNEKEGLQDGGPVMRVVWRVEAGPKDDNEVQKDGGNKR